MYNDYFKLVKLKTGETILCTMEKDIKSAAAESHISMTTPVQVIPHKETRKGGQVIGESFILRPWIGLSDSDEFVVSTDVILTIGNVKKEIKKQYIAYVDQTVEARKIVLEREECEEAAEALLRDVTPGEVKIIDDELIYGEGYHEQEEGDQGF